MADTNIDLIEQIETISAEGGTEVAGVVKQIELPPVGENTTRLIYDIAAKYDAEGSEIAKTYLPLAGGTMDGEISIGQGDGKGIQLGVDGRINATYTTNGTTSTTATLLGAINGSATIGHSEFQLKLRGKDGDSVGPTYNNKKVILENNLAGTTAGVVKQDDNGDVNISNGIITVKDDSHSHALASTISDWSTVRTALVQDWEDYTDAAIDGLINNAPGTLDTLKEIADFLKDENVVDGLVNLLSRKVDKAGDTMTGPLIIEHEGESSNPYLKLQAKHTTDNTLDRIWYVQSWKGPSDAEPYLYIGGSASGGQNPIKISDDGKLITNNSFSANKGVFTVLNETIGSDDSQVKIATSNGGALYFGTEGANNGTMFRFDQTSGTCRLRFRASTANGAMVWEQPEEGAYLCLDLGKKDKDYRRATFKTLGSGKNICAENLDITGNAATATKPNLTGTANALIHFNNEGTTFAKTNTASGALYSTTTNGAMQFGTLPIAQGGTGATTKANMRSNFEVPHLNSGNVFDGEQKMINSSYYSTMYDIASGIGCSLKNTRALDNQAIIGELLLPNNTSSGDGTANTCQVTAGEMGVYKIDSVGQTGTDNYGKITGKTLIGKFSNRGWIGNVVGNVTGNADTSSFPMGFAANGGAVTWGTLATDNGYQTIARWDSPNSGSVAFVDGPTANEDWKKRTSMQIDGIFYQKEGMFMAVDIAVDSNTKTNGVGKNNYLPKFFSGGYGTSGATLTNSEIIDDGSSITLGRATSIIGLLIPTVSTNHSGIKLGDTYLTAIDGNIIFQNNNAIRFGTDAWDYNQWAGLKYNHSNKTIYLGIADNIIFTANQAQSGGVIRTPGVSKISINGGQLSLTDAATFQYNTSDKCIDIIFN